MLIDFLFTLFFAGVIWYVIGGFAGVLVAGLFGACMGVVCAALAEGGDDEG